MENKKQLEKELMIKKERAFKKVWIQSKIFAVGRKEITLSKTYDVLLIVKI